MTYAEMQGPEKGQLIICRDVIILSITIFVTSRKWYPFNQHARQDFARQSRPKTCLDGQSGTGRLSFRLRFATSRRQTSGISQTRSARSQTDRSRDSNLSLRHSVRYESKTAFSSLRYLDTEALRTTCALEAAPVG